MTAMPVRPDHEGEPDVAETASSATTTATADDVGPAGDGAQTMSWWQDGAADDRPTADETAVGAVAAMADAHFAALVVQGLLLTGDRAVGEDLAYEALGRLRRDWFKLSDADQAPAYLRGAVTSLARLHAEDPAATAVGDAAPLVTTPTDADADADADPSSRTTADTTDEADTADTAAVDADQPQPATVRTGLAAVAADRREALVLRHHLHLPEHEAALCLCTSVAPLRALVRGGLGQLRTVLGTPVAAYDDARLATLVSSAGSDVVATLDPSRLGDALAGTRRVVLVPCRRRRADAAWLMLGILVGGAVAVGAVWRSHSGGGKDVAAIRQANVTTIVGRGADATTVASTAPVTVAASTVAPTTTTTATPVVPSNDVLGVTVTPAPTNAPIPTATTRGTTPARTPTTTAGSATTAQTTPPVPTASPTTVAPVTAPATTGAPPPTTAPPTTLPRGFALLNYGCARSDSSFFASGTADPSLGTVTVSGPDFSIPTAISGTGTWRVNGTTTATQQGSFVIRAAATGYSRTANVPCSA